MSNITTHCRRLGVSLAIATALAANARAVEQTSQAATPPVPVANLFIASPTVQSLVPDTRETLRRRAVNVDFSLLQSLALRQEKTVRLNLFDDTSFTAIVDQVDLTRPDSISFRGRIAEDDLGEFSLVQSKGVVVGIVRSPRRGALYSIAFSPEQVHFVRQLSEAKFGVCGNKRDAGVPTLASARRGEPRDGPAPPSGDATCGDDGALAVLVLYTNVAREAAGSVAAMEAEVQLAVDTSNTAYANSAIGMRMRLVRTQEISYDEAGTFTNHLDRLVSTSDGIIDTVHGLRDQYGADTVVLMVQDDDNEQTQALCGLAWQMETLGDSFKAQSFAIVNRGCASGNFSFPHEVGHNLGCDHDRANAGATQIYPYAFGWQFNGNPSGSRWRTLMAYNGSPSSSRVGYFSNPNVSFDGTPTGIQPGQTNESDNARVINNTALTATNWRRNQMWVQFGYGGTQNGCPGTPFNTFGGGVNAVPWTGTVIVRAGTTNERFSITKPMTLTSSGGIAIIGKL